MDKTEGTPTAAQQRAIDEVLHEAANIALGREISAALTDLEKSQGRLERVYVKLTGSQPLAAWDRLSSDPELQNMPIDVGAEQAQVLRDRLREVQPKATPPEVDFAQHETRVLALAEADDTPDNFAGRYGGFPKDYAALDAAETLAKATGEPVVTATQKNELRSDFYTWVKMLRTLVDNREGAGEVAVVNRIEEMLEDDRLKFAE